MRPWALIVDGKWMVSAEEKSISLLEDIEHKTLKLGQLVRNSFAGRVNYKFRSID